MFAQESLNEEATVVTVFSDSNKKYLSTDLSKVEPVKEGFISSEIELISMDIVKNNQNSIVTI